MSDIDKMVEDMLREIDKKDAEMPPEMIVRNSMVTPDGTELVSNSVHDYKSHEDANGETYVVDGGRQYFRRSVNEEPATDTSVQMYHGHEVVREAYMWGSRGPNGDQELTFIPLKDMTLSHIAALILDGYDNAPLMKAEQGWRKSAGARKMVRRKDIDRLMVLKDKYSHKPEIIEELDKHLENIIPKFNSNEFDGEPV